MNENTENKETDAKAKASPDFLRVKGTALKDAIDRCTESRATICSKGGISSATIKKALDGQRVTTATANRIVHGLFECGIPVTRDAIFELAR